MSKIKFHISGTLRNSIFEQFSKQFKIQYVFVALCFCLCSCEQYEPFENEVFSTNIPKGSRVKDGISSFDGFTYNYSIVTPDNQEIGIEIIPWFVDLPELMKSFIGYRFPREKQNSNYYDSNKSFNSFKLGLRTVLDCEIYKDDDLLDGWCYAFHTLDGESICIYTFARSGHCRPIKKMIEDFKLKSIAKPSHSSILEQYDNMMASWLQGQYPNSTIYFAQPTDLVRPYNDFPLDKTECGIMIELNDNMFDEKLGIRRFQSINLDSRMNFIAEILKRKYLINFKYPDNTIEAPLIFH